MRIVAKIMQSFTGCLKPCPHCDSVDTALS